MKKKLLYIVTSLDSTAPIKVVINLSKYAVEDYCVSICYVKEKNETCKIRECLENNGISCFKLSLASVYNLRKFDIVHTHGIIPDAVLSLARPFLNNSRRISTIHSDVSVDLEEKYGVLGYIASLFWIYLLKNMNLVVFLNQAVYSKYAKIAQQSTIIYNGIDIPKKSRCVYIENLEKDITAFSKGRKTVGYYGALREVKGVRLLIHAAAYVDAAFIIIGEGPLMPELKEYVKTHGLEDRVQFLGYVDSPERLLDIFDLFVIPSYSEGFPLAAIEALWSGCNIVSSDIVQLQEVFSGCCCNFFDAGSVDSLSSVLRKLVGQDYTKNLFNKKYYETQLTGLSMYNSYRDVYDGKLS